MVDAGGAREEGDDERARAGPRLQGPAWLATPAIERTAPQRVERAPARARVLPALLVCSLVGAAAWWALRRDPAPASTDRPTMGAGVLAQPTAPAPVVPAEPVADPAARSDAVDASGPPAQASGSAGGSRSRPEAASGRRRHRPLKPSQPVREVDCSPPYELDADGIRHVKPDCL
jgi:hypothetical protein